MSPTDIAIAIFAGLSALISLGIGLSSHISANQALAVSTDSANSAERSATAAEKSATIAIRQLEIATESYRRAQQPYLWADIRPRDDGGVFELMIGNAGPTVATNVRVTIEPSLLTITPDGERFKSIAERLAERLQTGLKSIAPGRTLAWTIGSSHEFYNQGDIPLPDLRITVTGSGPHGELDPVEYPISLEDLRYQEDRAVGIALLEAPLNTLNQSLKNLTKTVQNLGGR